MRAIDVLRGLLKIRDMPLFTFQILIFVFILQPIFRAFRVLPNVALSSCESNEFRSLSS